MKNYEDLLRDAEYHIEDSGEFLKDKLSANKDVLKIMGLLLAGAALGAVAGILLAPNRGADTRRSIGNTVKGLGSNIASITKEGANKVSDKVKSTLITSEPHLN
jgi:ABC-type uncharacterized transport system permease subunit